MKFKFYNLVLSLVMIMGYSQKITINWEGLKPFDRGQEQKPNYPYFSNPTYQFFDNSIYASLNFKTAGDITVGQMEWRELAPNEKGDLSVSVLPTVPETSISYFRSNEDQNRYANIFIETLKQENGRIFKLISFSINPSAAKGQTLAPPTPVRYGTTENPLKSGTFYKIKVDKSGIFKITRQFLQQNGINPSSVDPRNFRIYGNGGVALPEYNIDGRYSALQQDAIQVVGEEDGVWNDNDYALFYAQGPNAYNIYNRTNGKGYKRVDHRNDPSNNFINIYDDYSYYFINFDIGPGLRVAAVDNNLPATLITRFDDYQFLNEEKFNLVKLGRIWVGDAISGSREVNFTTRSPMRTGDLITFRAQAVAFNAQSTKINIDFNGQSGTPTTGTSTEIFYQLMNFSSTATNQTGNSLKFKFTPDTAGNPNGAYYFDYAEVQYKEDLVFNGTQMNFRDFSIAEGQNGLYGFSVSNAGEMEQIWDVSDITRAKRVTNKNAQPSTFNFGYLTNSPYFNNEFVAFKNSAAYTPAFVGRIDNQDLAALSGIDYLIVAQPSYFAQAQRLADYHKSKNNWNVAVVDVNKIYNEYSSGGKDITAIRDFVTKLYSSGSLKYVFLLGDTSYDYKNRIANNTDVLPSYQSEVSSDFANSYVTDDYFVLAKPQEVKTGIVNVFQFIPDLPIGRLPADNIQEAKILIDKTLAYYNALPNQSNPFGEWRMKMDFVADDDYEGANIPSGVPGPFHYLVEYAINQNFSATNKPEYNLRKLYLDAFPAVTSAGGQRYPQVNQAISTDMGNSLFMFYFGHGGINGWAQERVLTSTEVQGFNNFSTVYSRFPLVSTITCEFALWDDPGTNSVGEQMIKMPTGGAATMITSSRAISVDYGRTFTPYFINKLFSVDPATDDFATIGLSHLNAKAAQFASSPNINALRVNFLGDPAMKLDRPKRLIQIDNVDTPVAEQIRALDFVKVKGHINKADGTKDSSFNGRVVVNVFDKPVTKKTLNNDRVPESTAPMVMEFKEEPGAIVKASGKAVNGEFNVEFYVPKDINYTVGNGRLLVYAENFLERGSSAFDVFNNQDQKVGEINPNGINDSEPPAVNLYMNNLNFANGGITDQNPTLLACLKDNMGINAAGAGIGHDITFFLDGNIVGTTSVNDYYSSGDGNGCSSNLQDYQKGSVSYPLKNVAPGEHQLTFKVWDINNNSTTATLNFVVKDETNQKLEVNRLLNWPNPFTNKTYVQFEHNCDDILDVNVQIYTITGKIVRTLSATVASAERTLEGYRTPRQAIEWDGKDDFGDTVAKGTYIFKIFARSQNQEKCSGSATAVEKMVLLK